MIFSQHHLGLLIYLLVLHVVFILLLFAKKSSRADASDSSDSEDDSNTKISEADLMAKMRNVQETGLLAGPSLPRKKPRPRANDFL
eukprot:m.239860 g.239860  ORF g.239860 m.239860 type:complete len:86 (+) comp16073_c1_seq5:1-258(+)